VTRLSNYCHLLAADRRPSDTADSGSPASFVGDSIMDSMIAGGALQATCVRQSQLYDSQWGWLCTGGRHPPFVTRSLDLPSDRSSTS
ncbi:unnamed protein product, partial [Pylaiella littoralis]